METDDPSRPHGRPRQPHDRNRGSVRGEDGLFPDQPAQVRKQLQLERFILGDRLDHQPAWGQRLEVGGADDASQRLLTRLGFDLAALYRLGQRAFDGAPAPGQRRLIDIADGHVVAGPGAYLGDPGAHLSGSDDPQRAELHAGQPIDRSMRRGCRPVAWRHDRRDGLGAGGNRRAHRRRGRATHRARPSQRHPQRAQPHRRRHPAGQHHHPLQPLAVDPVDRGGVGGPHPGRLVRSRTRRQHRDRNRPGAAGQADPRPPGFAERPQGQSAAAGPGDGFGSRRGGARRRSPPRARRPGGRGRRGAHRTGARDKRVVAHR